MSSTFTFTPTSITVKGKTFPAGYSVSPSGSVFVFVQQDGKPEKTRVRFNPDHPEYAAALAAARNEQPAASADERPEIISEAPAADPSPAEPMADPVPVEPVADPAPAVDAVAATSAPADDAKAARGPVPEKTFIGKTIDGKGWKILFDGETSRTRIIFDGKPTDAARDVLNKAGFFFSAAMNSWNKKLTFKAYRAAQAVSSELSAIYA